LSVSKPGEDPVCDDGTLLDIGGDDPNGDAEFAEKMIREHFILFTNKYYSTGNVG
jgi:hypothetical protein